MHRRQHRSPPNIVCASFIANLRAIPACPRCLAGSVSPDCKRTSPCKQHDYRAIARRGQGHVQVRTNLYLRLWKFCREERPDFFRRFRRTCSSKTCANRSDRRICRQPSLRNSLLRCIANRRKRRPKSHAQRIGWPSLRARENRTGPIHQDAVGFRPAAIESQDKSHAKRISENAGQCIRGTKRRAQSCAGTPVECGSPTPAFEI